MKAVSTSTAADAEFLEPTGPVRTCIGCRRRAPAAELLRVAVAPEAVGTASVPTLGAQNPDLSSGDGPVALPVVPDPRRRIGGRGAWLHPQIPCVELAVRRRAFARALRASGPVDPAAVCEYVAQTDPAGKDQEHLS